MKDSQANNRTPGAGVAVASAGNATERFERGTEMRELYERMRPDQRTAIAGEFIRLLTLAGDSHAEQFRQKLQDHTQITGDAANDLLSAGQVEAIDGYVRQSHPEMITQLAAHPVTRSALEMPGVPVADETDTGAKSETVASASGPAYATSWEQTQQQGEEAAQRASEDESTDSSTEPPARDS